MIAVMFSQLRHYQVGIQDERQVCRWAILRFLYKHARTTFGPISKRTPIWRRHQDACHHPIPDIQRPDLGCSTGWRQFVLRSFPTSLHLHLILECKTAADTIGRVHGDGLMVCGTGIERDAEIPLPSITDRQAGSPCRFAGWSNLLCAFLYWPAALSAMSLDDDDDDEEDHLSRATQSTSPTLARCILSRILPTVQGGDGRFMFGQRAPSSAIFASYIHRHACVCM